MEYLIGSFITLIGVAVIYYVQSVISYKEAPVRLQVSQSRTHKMFAPILLNIGDHRRLETQSMNHYEGTKTRILFTEDTAYWIKDNAVFSAPLDPESGLILEDHAKEVDMIGMDKVQLNEMMFIVDKLTEGKRDDNRSPGN